MADQKRSIVKMRTPQVALRFPHIVEPDYGNRQFPRPEGEFNTGIRIDLADPAIKSMLDRLQAYHDEAVKRGRKELAGLKVASRKKLEADNPAGKGLLINPLYRLEYDEETEEETGWATMNFKTPASGVYKKGPKAGQKWTRKLPLFDALGNPIKKAPSVWGGTIAVVAFSFLEDGYFIPGTGACGIATRLEAVQIIKLVGPDQQDASAFGFTKHEDGFTADSVEDDDADGESDDISERYPHDEGAEGGDDADSKEVDF